MLRFNLPKPERNPIQLLFLSGCVLSMNSSMEIIAERETWDSSSFQTIPESSNNSTDSKPLRKPFRDMSLSSTRIVFFLV